MNSRARPSAAWYPLFELSNQRDFQRDFQSDFQRDFPQRVLSNCRVLQSRDYVLKQLKSVKRNR